mgnify:CR=1 FL=1
MSLANRLAQLDAELDAFQKPPEALDDLRARLGEAGVQVAVLDFLAAHERDLIACAHALGVEPPALILARARLSGEMFEP